MAIEIPGSQAAAPPPPRTRAPGGLGTPQAGTARYSEILEAMRRATFNKTTPHSLTSAKAFSSSQRSPVEASSPHMHTRLESSDCHGHIFLYHGGTVQGQTGRYGYHCTYFMNVFLALNCSLFIARPVYLKQKTRV